MTLDVPDSTQRHHLVTASRHRHHRARHNRRRIREVELLGIPSAAGGRRVRTPTRAALRQI